MLEKILCTTASAQVLLHHKFRVMNFSRFVVTEPSGVVMEAKHISVNGTAEYAHMSNLIVLSN